MVNWGRRCDTARVLHPHIHCHSWIWDQFCGFLSVAWLYFVLAFFSYSTNKLNLSKCFTLYTAQNKDSKSYNKSERVAITYLPLEPSVLYKSNILPEHKYTACVIEQNEEHDDPFEFCGQCMELDFIFISGCFPIGWGRGSSSKSLFFLRVLAHRAAWFNGVFRDKWPDWWVLLWETSSRVMVFEKKRVILNEVSLDFFSVNLTVVMLVAELGRVCWHLGGHGFVGWWALISHDSLIFIEIQAIWVASSW